jgi:hypothetical protein
LRGRRPRPLDDGALGKSPRIVQDDCSAVSLGYQDSNLD